MLRVAKNTEMPGIKVYRTKTNVAWASETIKLPMITAYHSRVTGMLRKFSKFCWTSADALISCATVPMLTLEGINWGTDPNHCQNS